MENLGKDWLLLTRFNQSLQTSQQTKVQDHGDSLVNSIKHLKKFNNYTLGSMDILTINSTNQ